MACSLQQPGDLRRHARLELARRAWCEHRDWTLYLLVGNVSHGGVFIQTATPFARGERLRVCLMDREAPVAALMELEVEVCWSSARGRSVGIGCRIVDFAQGAERYAALVEQLAQNGR